MCWIQSKYIKHYANTDFNLDRIKSNFISADGCGKKGDCIGKNICIAKRGSNCANSKELSSGFAGIRQGGGGCVRSNNGHSECKLKQVNEYICICMYVYSI